jgi:hypothetical protein
MFCKYLILFVSLFSVVGCTSMRPVDLSQSDFAGTFEPGDHLVVYERQGRIIDMRFTGIENGVMFGSLYNDGLTSAEVVLRDIEKIEIEKISGAKTTGAVLGGIVLLPIVAAGAVVGIAASGTY